MKQMKKKFLLGNQSCILSFNLVSFRTLLTVLLKSFHYLTIITISIRQFQKQEMQQLLFAHQS